MIAKFDTNPPKGLNMSNPQYAIIYTTPKGLNAYRNRCAEKGATPMGSNIVLDLFFYRYSNPSDCVYLHKSSV